MAQEISTQVSLYRWDLAEPEDMWVALSELTSDPHGYVGNLSMMPHNGTGPNVCLLTINVGEGRIVEGRIGDQIVRLAGVLESLTQDEYDAKYGG